MILHFVTVKDSNESPKRPLSKGAITLKSSDPRDAPIMDPQYFQYTFCFLQTLMLIISYLQDPADKKRLVRGVKLLLKLAKTNPLSTFADSESKDKRFDTRLHSATDAEIEQFVEKNVETLYHPACTCRMAPLEEGGVVDSEMRVYGVQGLRVCDASVFPSMISGHTVRLFCGHCCTRLISFCST
jgi:choline dehydrogenase